MALKLEIQAYQILTNDDEVCIPSLSSIVLAVEKQENMHYGVKAILNFYSRFFKSFLTT